MNYLDFVMYAVIAVAVGSLAFGSYTDVRKRTVKAVLFVPLVGLATAQNYFLHLSSLYIIMGVLIFFFTFLEPDTYAYLIIGAIFFLVSFVSMVISGFFWGFQLLLMSIVFILGFQERLFGIGDIKAIISLMYATPFYPSLVYYLNPHTFFYNLPPTSLALLTDICIFAVVFVIYAIIKVYRHGTVDIPGQPLAMRYSEDEEGRNSAAYRKLEKNGVKFMVYRIPFIVPIALGYILFITTGYFPNLL